MRIFTITSSSVSESATLEQTADAPPRAYLWIACSRDDFAALLNQTLGGENEGFEGRVVKGTVTAIENDMAVIDVGLKSEGRVALREFAPAPGQKADLKVGDRVVVGLPEQALLQATLTIYGLPLFGLLLGAMLASMVGARLAIAGDRHMADAVG